MEAETIERGPAQRGRGEKRARSEVGFSRFFFLLLSSSSSLAPLNYRSPHFPKIASSSFSPHPPSNFSFPSLRSHLPPPLPRIARAGEQVDTKAPAFCLFCSERGKRGNKRNQVCICRNRSDDDRRPTGDDRKKKKKNSSL